MRDDCDGSAPSMRQANARIPARPRRTAACPKSNLQVPSRITRSPADEPGDRFLVCRARSGDQDAATHLYLRYHNRLTNLVRKRCSSELARWAGVEDVVQSVFATFFRRIAEGCYEVADGDTAWKVLLVMALNRVRSEATYYYAAKRDAHRNVSGPTAQEFLESKASSRQVASAHIKMVFLQDALERLPCSDRYLVGLRIEGFTVAEVAERTGRSTRTVERIIRGTRLKLSDLLR
jgi:RNA polymerase sigma-70 factor, ECF subfamily